MEAFSIVVLVAATAWGFIVLRYPRLYRIGVASFCLVALLALFVVWFAGPRVALAHFERAGGTYSNELAKLFGSVVAVNLVFYAAIAVAIVFLGLIALRAISLQAPGRDA